MAKDQPPRILEWEPNVSCIRAKFVDGNPCRGLTTNSIRTRKIGSVETVGDSLSNGFEMPFSEAVRRNAWNITNILDGQIMSLRFETPARDFVVSGKTISGAKSLPMKYSLGTIKSMVQTVSMRKKLSFTVWDALFDKPVNCYLKEGDAGKGA